MAKEMIAMILAGGQGSRLYALTQKLAKPAVPFGGKYRIIDFPLSNCANSGIDTVGVQLLAVIPESRVLQLAGANGTVPPAADPAVVAGQAMAKRLCGQRVPLTF